MIQIINNWLTCRICKEVFLTTRDRNKHLKEVHGLDLKEYVLQYYLDNKIPECQCGCKTIVNFSFFKNELKVNEYTRNHFPRQPHSEETKNKIKKRTKEALLEKYGVENIYLSKILKQKATQKIKDTKKERYDNENYNNMDQNKQTKLKIYGNEKYNNPEQIIKTNQKKYRANSFTSTEEGKNKVAQTKRERYGDENYNNMEKNAHTKKERYGYISEFLDPKYRKKYNSKNSKLEKEVCEQLEGEHKFIYKNKEFDIKKGNNIYEIDGDFWHPSILNELTLSQINSVINDKKKINLITDSEYNLYKIHISNLPNVITEENLQRNSYDPDYSISYRQKIMTKEYFRRYIELKGKDKLKKYIPILLKFIRTFHPEFPYLPQEENLQEVIDKISKYDLTRIKKDVKTFRNNSTNLGVNYLKSTFKSYWNSSFKGHKTSIEVWADDEIMKKVIEYRLGINESDEVFDFSLHQLIRGLSARRYTISFFKPVLATAIYREYLGDNKNPIVIDPCAGFGGRLLGFKSKYPDGTYIGIEPNKDTYNELVKLVNDSKFTEVYLYNCKFEDFNDIPDKYDLVFTSIPYYDTEIYSNKVEYVSFKEWKNFFIKKFYEFNNVILNMNYDMCKQLDLTDKIEFNVETNTTHFDGMRDVKKEVIVKI